MLPLSMIVAIGNNGAIGYKGKIPWHISEDMSYFKKITQGHAIIMGRKTWNEIGKPLQGRRNIVLSKQFVHKDVEVFSSIEDAISSARTTDLEPIIIGGSSIYTQAMPFVTKIYLTEVNLTVTADTFFINGIVIDKWKVKFLDKKESAKEIEFVVLVRNDNL